MLPSRQIGIQMVVDSTSVTTGTTTASRDFQRLGDVVDSVSSRASSGISKVNVSVLDLVKGAAGLSVITGGVQALGNAITALPREGFNYSKQLEVSQVGMAGILGSMTALNGRQTDYNTALGISSKMIRQLNDDALRTAASSSELVNTFQALLAPGLASRMNLEQIRELTVVGTNAVKSMGMAGGQVVQELRDLVQGGITASSSTLASALGLKDEDIARAKASSEGLFAFLMQRLQGFKASSEAFGGTMQGQLDSLKEAAVRVAAEGMSPLTAAIKSALGETVALFGTFDAGKDAQLNPQLIQSLQGYAQTAADALQAGQKVVAGLWEHREAISALWMAYKAYNLGIWASEAAKAIQAKNEMAAAARLSAAQSAVEAGANAQVALSSREKLAAYLAELQAKEASAQAEVALQRASLATLAQTREAIVLSRAEVVAKIEATRATMAQAEAQLQAARAAGAQSYALALVKEATNTLAAAQVRQSALMAELALLGQQQARVQAATAAATASHEAAVLGANNALSALTVGTGSASIASRTFGTGVGALGGPVGIAIMAVSALAMWLYKLKSAADDAAVTSLRVARANAAIDQGKPVDQQDLTALQAELSRWRDKRDKMLADGTQSTTEWIGGARYTTTLNGATEAIGKMEGQLKKASDASMQAGQSTAGLSLTLTGAEQAWRKANEGAKTASAAQTEYDQKLGASRLAYDNYVKGLKASNASPEQLASAAKLQAEAEKAFGVERDKKIKEMGASAASAQTHAIDAQIEAVQRGYKLMQLRTADGLDEIGSLRKRDLITEAEEVQQRLDLGLKDVAAKAAAQQAELRLLAGKKDSAKQQAGLQGQLQELTQQRVNLEKKAARDLLEIEERRAAASRKLHGDALNSIYAEVQALAEKNRTDAQEIETIGLTREALQRLTEARLDSVIARQQERIETLRQFDTEDKSRDLINAEIAKLEELQRARELSSVRFGRETIRTQQDNWRAFFGDIYSGLTDSLYRGFEQGGKFFSTFWAGIKNTLKTTVLKVAIQGVVGLTASSLGIAGTGSDAAGTGLGLVNNASSLYSGYTAVTGYSSGVNTAAALAGAGSTAGASALSLGYGNAVGAVGGDALGAMIAANGSWQGVAVGTGYGAALPAGTAAAVEAGAVASATGATATGAAAGGGMASTVASAVPYVAIALLAANALGLFRSKTVNDSGIVGTLDSKGGSLQAYTETRKGGTLFSGPSYSTSYGALDAAQTKAIGDVTRTVYDSARQFGATLGYTSETIDGYTQQIDVSTRGLSAEKWTEALGLEYTALANNLANRVVPGVAQWAKEGEISSVTLARLATSLTQVNAVATAVHLSVLEISGAGGDAASKLIEAAGGLDKLTALSQSYYDAVMTDAEKSYDRAKSVLALIGAAGFDGAVAQTGDAMRAEYRRITDAQDVTTESGRQMRLQLMAGAAQFAAYADELSATGKAATEAAKDLSGARKSLEDQIFALRNAGNTAAIRARELGDVDPSLQGLQTTLWGLQDAADAAAKAAERAAAVEQERSGLQRQLMQLLGDTAGLRALEIGALDESNRALQEHIYAIQDARAAEEAAKAAVATAGSAVQSAFNILQNSVAAEKAAIQKKLQAETDGRKAQIEAARAAADTIRGIASSLTSALKSVQVESFAAERARLFAARAVIDSARGASDLSQVAGLQDALSVAGQDSRKFYSSFADYAYDQAVTANTIGSLSNTAQQQLSTAQSVVDGLAAQDTLARMLAEAEMAALDAQLAQAKSLMDATLGNTEAINGVGVSVVGAIGGLNTAIAGYAAAVSNQMAASQAAAAAAAAAATAARSVGSSSGGGGGGGGGGGAVGGSADIDPAVLRANTGISQYLVNAMYGGPSDQVLQAAQAAAQYFNAGGLLGNAERSALSGITPEEVIYNSAKQSGLSFDKAVQALGIDLDNAKAWAAGRGLPEFAVGTNYLPADMLALVHQGERIVPAADNRRLMEVLDGGGSGAADRTQADLLLKVLDSLQRMEPALRAIASNTLDTAKRINNQNDQSEVIAALARKKEREAAGV